MKYVLAGGEGIMGERRNFSCTAPPHYLLTKRCRVEVLISPYCSISTVHRPLIASTTTMRNCFVSLAAISSLSGTAAWTAGSRRSSSAAAGMPPSFILAIRGGANEYETKFESVKCSVLEKASKKVSV